MEAAFAHAVDICVALDGLPLPIELAAAHAPHALSDAGEAALAAFARDRANAWTSSPLAARPRLGSEQEVAWYHALDDGHATVRATLAHHLTAEPGALGARLAPRLPFYWYYRAGLVEGTRRLQLGRDIIRDGEPTDVVLAASGWPPDAVDLVIDVHEQLTRIAEDIRDPDLNLLIDAIDCLALVINGHSADAVRNGEGVHHRAVTFGRPV